MSAKEIQIGCKTWAYEVDGSYTNITDPDGEITIQLSWVATEGEVRAAAYGLCDGIRIGRKLGEGRKMADIKKVLGIPVL